MNDANHASKIARIIEAYPADRRFALAAMQDMQHEFNYIPAEGLSALAAYLGCTTAHLYSMATFYKALSLNPKGEHIIKICNGTACHLRGSVNLATEIKRVLGIEPGQTSADGEFSVEYVNCLGSCALAPVMVVDGMYYNKLKVDQISGIIDRYKQEDAARKDAKDGGDDD
ncbi:MAG: NAD(P)H-dependent oxidoreductase subunit E [Eggerthellaceae bacterium]|nr:NAD(P)H-dependent oxidoreductase subunit E [Eggerthellaceae bacterium]